MHEFSMARGIFREVQEFCRTRAMGSLRAVTMELGEFSGIESALLESAFKDVSTELLGYPAKLIIQSIPLEAECVRCAKRFLVVDFHFHCPDCIDAEVQITRGEEVRLIEIQADRGENCS
jgi:hydrogenase nickel incorporation protein HypA/HybF